jgi:hypothetical protein
MTFSKLNFAAACLLLGTSGLLVSCGGTKPDSGCVETADCTRSELKGSPICPESSQSTRHPRESEEPKADCIHPDLAS